MKTSTGTKQIFIRVHAVFTYNNTGADTMPSNARRKPPLLVGRKQTVVRDQLFPQKPSGSRLVFWSREVSSAVHPASPRPSSVPRANPVLTHRLLSSLSLSAAVRQFCCNDRWYERPGLWTQLALHRQRHRICRYLVTACLDSLPSPHFYGLGPPRPGGSQGR